MNNLNILANRNWQAYKSTVQEIKDQWSVALGVRKTPPVELLRTLMLRIKTSEERQSVRSPRWLLNVYLAMLQNSPHMRTIVNQDMVLFDTLAATLDVLPQANVIRTLRAIVRQYNVPGGRFLMLFVRGNLGIREISEATEQRAREGHGNLRSWIFTPDDLDKPNIVIKMKPGTLPLRGTEKDLKSFMTTISTPQLLGGDVGKTTQYVIGLGVPGVGPPYSISNQVIRVAKITLKPIMASETQPWIGPWTYYRAGDTTQTAFQ